MPSIYELSDLEVEILLWAVGRATYAASYPAPVFTALEIKSLLETLERSQPDDPK